MRNILLNSFEKIYCINLKKRTDKWKRCTEIFKKLNIEDIVIKWDATESVNKNKKGDCEYACASSHISIIKHANKNKINNILIFEDDIEFVSDYKGIPAENILQAGLNQIKKDNISWDLLFLGYSMKLREFCNYRQLSPNIFQSTNQLQTHCYAVNSSIYEKIINDNVPGRAPIDQYYGIYLAHKVVALNLFPLITHQRENILCDIGGNIRTDRSKLYNNENNYWSKKIKGYEKDCSTDTRAT